MKKANKKVGFVSLGCPKNLTDTESMLGSLVQSGYQIVGSEQDAEIMVINTCAFLEASRAESAEMIDYYAERKKQGKHQKLYVVGCLPSKDKEKVLADFPLVDGILESQKISEISSLLTPQNKIRNTKSKDWDSGPLHRMLTTPGYRAYLKISEGCNHTCTFCTIPSIRGLHISRPMEHLIAEAEVLAKAGVKELTLIAQDSTYYGLDLYHAFKLPELIQGLSAVSGIEWIRIHYAYPDLVSDELIDIMAGSSKLCHYLDMPLQHISDKLLKAMRRQSQTKKIRERIAAMQQAMPDLALRTTLIVGFPGETEKEFEELLDFIEETKFTWIGAFKYSQEKGTPSADFPNQVEENIKEERYHRLMEAQRRISKVQNEKMLGQKVKVLVESAEQGRSYRDAPDVDGSFLFESRLPGNIKPGTFIEAKVHSVDAYDLKGIPVLAGSRSSP